jgi:soluble lytic murein transglycosylase-like protein
MEKRRKKTLARTLNCGAACTKLVLIIVLFVPVLLAFELTSAPTQRPADSLDAKVHSVVERVRPKNLVKVYSIVKSRRPDIADSEAWRISQAVLDESLTRNFDPLLVLAVIQIESEFQHAAVSPVGARGMMQIMPDTGKYLAEALHRERGLRPVTFKPELLDDPLINIRLGTYYLHDLRKRFQNLGLALIAYNLGPGEVLNRIENKIEFSDEFAVAVMDTYRNFKKSPAPRF